jgi:hypothetical protein
VFVCEVEEEDVICLPVNRFLNRIGLVGDEGGEYAEVAHASHDVIPIGFPQVKMSFLSEEKHSFELPVRKGIDKFAQSVFDDDLSVNV